MSDTIKTMASESARFLQSQSDDQSHSRTNLIRTIMYALVISMCFFSFAVLLYCGEPCYNQQSRLRNQHTEDADVAVATTVLASVEEQSETRAIRKKNRAERRALIVLLLSPVSIVSL
jgi:hypothetical protein